MSNFESFASPQAELLQGWGRGFQEKNRDLLAEGLHKDYRHIIYPRSLNQPEQTKEQWLECIDEHFILWTKTESTTHSMVEVPGKVIIHFTNKTSTKYWTDEAHEAVLTAHIVPDDDGNLKIGRIEEFVDSETYRKHMEFLAKAKAN